jgi:hypothetical protein
MQLEIKLEECGDVAKPSEHQFAYHSGSHGRGSG